MATKQQALHLPYNFEPRWYQLDVFKAFDNGTKYFCLVWARRHGKDLMCWNLMIREAFRNPGSYFYFFPTYGQARKAIWEESDISGRRLMDYIPGWEGQKFPNEYIKRINNQAMVVELTNGSIIRMVASNEVENSIIGTNPRGAVFSEFGTQTPLGFKLMMPVFQANKGWFIVNGTPKGRNHFYDLFQKASADKKWFTKELPIDKSQIYSPAEIKEMEEQYAIGGMSPDEIRQELYCDWSAAIRGSYYGDCLERARNEGRIAEFPHNRDLYTDTFWDIGLNDATTIWFRQIQKGKVVFTDCYSATGESPSHFVDVLKDKDYKYRTHYLPHDGEKRHFQPTALVSVADMLRELLVDAKLSDDVYSASKPRVQAGITAVRQRFSMYHFNEVNCQEGLLALESYHKKWDPTTFTYSDTPVHDWSSHYADALRVEAIVEGISETPFGDAFNSRNVKVITDFDIG